MIEFEIAGRPDNLITIPQRGLRIIPPQETAENMVRVQRGERILPWSDRERARLALIKKDPIMKKRFRDRQGGEELMSGVSYERRQELLSYAEEMKDIVVVEWEKISPNKQIAVILFGSVARGLVKDTDHEDPSNIDMSIVGNITPDERLQLLDAVRPARKNMQCRILEDCSQSSFPDGSGNVGLYVQSQDKLINNKFATAKEYISSNAFVLHDPSGVWANIEGAALDHEVSIMQEKKERQERRRLSQHSREQVIYVSA